MKTPTANQNLISTSPLFSPDKDELSPMDAPPVELPASSENKASSDFTISDEHKQDADISTTAPSGHPLSPPPLLESEESDQNENNIPTPYEVKHIVVGELEPDDDVWVKKKQRTDAFLKGVASAKKWAPILTGDISQLPDTIRTKLYVPDIPDKDQEENIKGDIVKEWYAEHFPSETSSLEEIEKMWPDIRQSLSESLNADADDTSLYQSVSQKNRDYNATLKELEKQFQHAEEQAHQTFSSTVKEDNFTVPADWLAHIPDEMHHQVKQALSEHHQEEIQRVKRLKPLYNEMRKAIKNMASFEEIKTVSLPMSNKAGGYEEVQFPLMFNIQELINEYPSLPVTGLKLRQLSPEDRMLLFSQVDQDITAEAKQKNTPANDFLSDLGHAVSRSHMKGVYGISYLSTAFDSISKDLAAQILKILPESNISHSLSDGLKDLAQKDRDTMANVQRMRDLAENRENPLYPQPDEQGNMTTRQWLKQCFLGFAEESVPIALAVGFKPALLGWGGATIGNKYARYEAEAAEKDDYESVHTGVKKKTSSLAHANRFLSAIAMGGLQTLMEAGAYGKVFSPIVKSMPKTSAAFGIGVRPYLEQKAIALTEPLGSASAEFVTQGLEEGKWNTFDSDRMIDALGSTKDNTREYLMNLPFILLATGKVSLHHFKSRKTILNDPALSSRYKIPQKMINRIKKEKDPQSQSLLLQKALRESPLWENPHILYTTTDFLNKIEPPSFNGSTMGRYTPGSLAQLLELPPEKAKNYPVVPLPEQKWKQEKTLPSIMGKLPPLEKKQMYWHSRSGLPTISPVIKNNQIFWELKYRQKPQYYSEGLYESPNNALTDWLFYSKSLQISNREQALYKKNIKFNPIILKTGKDGTQLEAKIKKNLSAIDELSSERLLYRSNLHNTRQLQKRTLNSLQKAEEERIKAHIIEDAMQYAMDVPYEQIVSNRLARMWSDELKSQRITSREATSWIDHWETTFQKKLNPLAIDGFSPKHPYSSLSSKLAKLSMQPEILSIQGILPPAFTEPSRLAFKQLSTANELTSVLSETLFYSSQRRSGIPKEESMYKTLKNYIPQHEKITRRNTTYFKKGYSINPLLKKDTIILDDEFKQNLLWMEEQGISPLLSLSHKKTGQTQWLTVYPDGRLSRPHPTPQEALLEWKEYGLNTKKIHLHEMGKNATNSLIEFYYGENNNKRQHIKTSIDNKLIKSSEHPKMEKKWNNERNKIAKLQNPHIEHTNQLDFYTGGSNTSNITPMGFYEQKINIHRTSDPLTIIEEHAEVSWSDLMTYGILPEKKAMKMLQDIQKKTNQVYLPSDLGKKDPVFRYLNIIEGLSQLSREYMMSQNSNKKLPTPLREWISHMYISPQKDLHAIPLLRRSAALNRIIESGKIPQDFLNMLKESIGLNDRFNNERKLPYSPHKLRLIPLMDHPFRLFESLPEKARSSVSQKLLSLPEKSKLSPSLIYKTTKQKLSQLDNDIKKYPELLEWDYDETSKTYISLDNIENKSNIPPAINNLEKEQIEKDIHAISLLRRSLVDMPQSEVNGIRLRDKVFSEQSADRPKGMNNSWKVHMDRDSEGLIYMNNDLPGHIVRLSPGFIHDPHNNGKHPYIRHIVNGHYLDAQGNIRSPYSPSTFIPLEKFSYDSHSSSQGYSRHSFSELLDTLSDKKRLEGLLYRPNIAEMTTPTELVFQLGELKKKISLNKKAMKRFIPLYQSVNRLKRYPESSQTDLDFLTLQAKKLKTMLSDRTEEQPSQKK